jgi:hypothetical protein
LQRHQQGDQTFGSHGRIEPPKDDRDWQGSSG